MTNNFRTEDSGKRVEYATGAVRDTDEGKPRYDLISKHGLTRLAELMARGAKKYGERNWEKGQPVSRYFASAFRHLMQYALGDRSEDHIMGVVFNMFGIAHVEEENKLGKIGFMELLDLDIYQTPHEVQETSVELSLERKVLYILDHARYFSDDTKSNDLIAGEVQRGLKKEFGVDISTGEVRSALEWLLEREPRVCYFTDANYITHYYTLPF
jgi:dATP/dGTP diphosphohydrolase